MALPEKSDYNSLGGEIINYSDVEDPTTDLDAEFSNETRLDVSGMTQTCVTAIVSFIYNGSSVVVGNTEQDYMSVYGRASDYKPIVTRTGTGQFLVTIPASIVDARGNTRNNNIRFGSVCCEGLAYFGNFSRLTANTCRVTTCSGTSVLDPGPTDRITVFIY